MFKMTIFHTARSRLNSFARLELVVVGSGDTPILPRSPAIALAVTAHVLHKDEIEDPS